MDAVGQLDRSGRALIAVLLGCTGFAALVNQIAWQRVIALHAGVDLASSTTVVVAFLAGLGIGSLVGGRVADRLDRRAALVALGLAGLLVAAYSLVSIWLLYDVYRSLAAGLELYPLRVGFNVLVLLVPTTFMGMSLPLVARAIATEVGSAGSAIGRYSAANTLGAAIGAAAGGWIVLGSQGFDGAVRLAATVEAAAAVCFLGLAGSVGRRYTKWGSTLRPLLALSLGGVAAAVGAQVAGEIDQLDGLVPVVALLAGAAGFVAGTIAFSWNNARPSVPTAAPREDDPAEAPEPSVEVEPRMVGSEPVRVWYLAYAATGAVALGFEQVFFRLVDGVMRSNSYTFAHVLSLYLVLLSVGMALGSWLRVRVADDRKGFLWIQFGVGVSAVAALVVFTRVLPESGLGDSFDLWFNSDGFAAGFGDSTAGQRVLYGVVLPLWLMGLPVLLMGAAFPFVQALVTRDLETVGSRTGTLVFANLAGNVGGALLTSFVLIEHLGTAGAYRVLLVPLALAGAAGTLLVRPRLRIPSTVAVVGSVVVLALLLPTNEGLWARLHGTTPDAIAVAEDRACASALEHYGDDRYQLTINGAGQNGYPFDDFHVLIGLLPALAHPEPERALAVGLGIGSTSSSLLLSDRVQHLDTVELCGGIYDLLDDLAQQGIAAFERLDDPSRHREIEGDGRRHLITTDVTYDIVVPDTLRPNSAGSGNLYSVEFQELVDEQLADDGLTVGWVPTFRALSSVSLTFPYVVTLTVPSYNDSVLYVASRSPIPLDPTALVERLDALPSDALPEAQRTALRELLADLDPVCVNDGQLPERPDGVLLNVDLRPRDEYFLTNGGIGEEQVARTCS